MSDIQPSELADSIFELVKENFGKKKFRPTELQREMATKFGVDKIEKRIFKKAMREVIDSGRLIYTFYSGTYVEMPHEDKAE